MPIDRGAIDTQLGEIGEGERWWEQREFRDLPYILHPDESILGLVNGKLVGRRRPRTGMGSRWLLVVTNQRFIGLNQGRFARKQVEIPVGQITRLQQRSGFRTHQITIESAGRRYRIRIAKGEAYRFASALIPLVPEREVNRLHPDLEPLSWIPGIRTVAALPAVSGILSKVSSLSPPDPYGGERLERVVRLEATVERLQDDLERLQQQVNFLENLLENQASERLRLSSPPVTP
jgi:hypothetical protein